MSNQISNTEFTRRREAATPRGVGVMCNFYADRADNAELWDIEGNRYIDFASGIAVLNTGHRHPRSEEHTSELQSLMRISYAVFCLKKQKTTTLTKQTIQTSTP